MLDASEAAGSGAGLSNWRIVRPRPAGLSTPGLAPSLHVPPRLSDQVMSDKVKARAGEGRFRFRRRHSQQRSARVLSALGGDRRGCHFEPHSRSRASDGDALLAHGRYGVMVAVKTSSFNDGANEARRSVHTGWTTPPIAAIPS